MAKVYASISGRLQEFVDKQHVFFVATAPLAADGHVNVSPRGIKGTFGVVDEHTFAWVDGTGSGSETIAHLRENGRVTVMFCAFAGAPNIVRFHGTGRVVSRYDDGYDDLAAQITGWQAPASYAIAVDGELPHLNLPGGQHGLPAVVLATVLKHDGATATIEMSRQQLDEAITALAPAAACTDVEHPNLAAWRRIRDRLDERGGATLTAVFVRDLADPVTSEVDAALRAAF